MQLPQNTYGGHSNDFSRKISLCADFRSPGAFPLSAYCHNGQHRLGPDHFGSAQLRYRSIPGRKTLEDCWRAFDDCRGRCHCNPLRWGSDWKDVCIRRTVLIIDVLVH
jgi:hypothetical protein